MEHPEITHARKMASAEYKKWLNCKNPPRRVFHRGQYEAWTARIEKLQQIVND